MEKLVNTSIVLLVTAYLQIFLLVTNEAVAYFIEIDVEKVLGGDITSFYYNSSTDLVNFNIEFRNRGSIAYKARIRIDASKSSDSNETNETFSAWGPEKVFMPGDKKSSELCWYNNETGNFSVRVRVYYAGEILEKFFEIEKKESMIPQEQIERNMFEIRDFRTYDDFVIFDIVSKEDAKDVVIIPTKFRKGWIFEQEKIRLLKKGRYNTVALKYDPGVFAKDNITISIVSDDSKLFSEKTFTLEKKKGVEWVVFYIIDFIRFLTTREN